MHYLYISLTIRSKLYSDDLPCLLSGPRVIFLFFVCLRRKDSEDADARLAAANTQNEVLHSHLQTLTQQLEAQLERREADDRAIADKQLARADSKPFVLFCLFL